MRRCAGCGCLQARRGEGTVVRQWRRRCRGGAAGTAYVAVACHCHRECSWFYYLHGVTLELRLAQLTRREPVQGCAPLLLTASCPSWHWTRLPRCTPPPLPSACWACAGCQQPWPARSEALPSPRPAPCQGGPQGQPPGPRRGSCWSTGGEEEADASEQLGRRHHRRHRRKHRTCEAVRKAAGRSVVQYGTEPGEYPHTGEGCCACLVLLLACLVLAAAAGWHEGLAMHLLMLVFLSVAVNLQRAS